MPEPSLPQLALTVLTVDFLRYAITAGVVWLLIEVVLGRRLAHRRLFSGARPAGQVRREIVYSMSTVLIFAANGLLTYLLARNGTIQIEEGLPAHGWAWWTFSLVLIIRHHASLNPTPWAAYAFHPIEALIQAVFLPLYLLLVPTHAAVIGVFLVHMIVRNTVGHTAHEVFPWRWTPRGWLRWITPVSHHHFHHAHNRGNYGLYFTWWDRWCGTEDAQYLRDGDARFSGRPATGSAR
jgi:lathosterol oxidase